MGDPERRSFLRWQLLLIIACVVGCGYYFSNPRPSSYYNYPLRIASVLLEGELGLSETPPQWLNEFIPLNGRFYSVFPFGSVLTQLPLALLKRLGVIQEMPGMTLAALIAVGVFLTGYFITGWYELPFKSRVVLSLFPVAGSWLWTNLAFAGAWQLAIGFAVLGEFGAILWTLVRPRPLLAGCFFALAFGNRTEIIVTAPVFFYFLLYPHSSASAPLRARVRSVLSFCAAPFALGVLTLLYNYLRFGSPLDFGYSRIPGCSMSPGISTGFFHFIQFQEIFWK